MHKIQNFAIVLSLSLVVGCGNPRPDVDESTRSPAVQLGDGIYDFSCLKGKNASTMAGCKIGDSSGSTARGSHAYDFLSAYYLLNLFSFNEPYTCGYLGWGSSCYSSMYGSWYPYYYDRYYTGYYCNPGYLFAYNPYYSQCYY